MSHTATHKLVRCSCGRVIANCRCAGPKPEETRQHPACGIEPPLNAQAPALTSRQATLADLYASMEQMHAGSMMRVERDEDGRVLRLALLAVGETAAEAEPVLERLTTEWSGY